MNKIGSKAAVESSDALFSERAVDTDGNGRIQMVCGIILARIECSVSINPSKDALSLVFLIAQPGTDT